MAEDTLTILCRLVAEACALDPGTVLPDDPLRGYGLDSVRAMELSVLIEDAFGQPVPLQTMASFRQATVRELADFVVLTTEGSPQGER